MEKRFNEWNDVAQRINSFESDHIYFTEGEIWWCFLGANIGHEQDGKGGQFMRPILILKKFNRTICWVIPLSMQAKRGSFFLTIYSKSSVSRTAILPQMRVIDCKRLDKKIDEIDTHELSIVHEKIIEFLR